MKKKIVFIVFVFIALTMSAVYYDDLNIYLEKLAFKMSGVQHGNLFQNADFSRMLDAWSHTSNVECVKSNEINYICITGNPQSQCRLWQTFQVSSGTVYRLSFKSKSSKNIAFGIFRNLKNNNEKYLWCNAGILWRDYAKEYVAVDDCKLSVYMSAKGEGKYYFCSPSFEVVSNYQIKRFFSLLKLLLVALAFVLIVLTILAGNNSFVAIMLFLLLVPLLNIDTKEKSVAENRMLNKFKPLMNKNGFNVSFGTDFNNWINDRFNFRQLIISSFTKFKILIDRRIENESAFQGKDGWLFQKFNLLAFKDNSEISKMIKSNMELLTRQCNEIGINTVFASIPEKNFVYSDCHTHGEYASEQLAPLLEKDSKVSFVDLHKCLDEAKKDNYIYFKDDHHWTQFGAFAATKSLCREFQKYIPEIPTLSINDYKEIYHTNTYSNVITKSPFSTFRQDGSILRMLNISFKEYGYTTAYPYFLPIKKSIPKPSFPSKFPFYTVFSNPEVKVRKIMIVGDSNIGFMIPFITSMFSESLFLQINDTRNGWSNNWKIRTFSQVIKDYKPDILLLITRSSNLQSWLYLSMQ